MILFRRNIGKVEIYVYLDRYLYYENVSILSCIFSTFQEAEHICSSKRNSIFILPSNKYPKELYETSYYIECDTLNPQWITKLVGKLEEWYAEVIDCTVIHGSCVRLLNKNILLVGARMAGKTTLTSYLTINRKAMYLDDDCVYFFMNELVGFNMPIAIRKNVDELSTKNMICASYDAENNKRILLWPPERIDKLSSVDVILFPTYNTEGINRIVELEGGRIVNNMIKNIRHSQNIDVLFHDICKLANNVKAFQISYSTSREAYELIYSAIYY